MIRDTRREGRPNEAVELVHLRAGEDPPWERPHRNGEDITDMPERWSPYQRERRLSFEARVAEYKARGML